MSAYELADEFRLKSGGWSRADIQTTFQTRVEREKARCEIRVDYYRIGYTISYPLPLDHRPEVASLPHPIPNMQYPWLIWLTWDLEERWRLLHEAWRKFDDARAGHLLQRELAALSGWNKFTELDGNVGLATGHLAASLALALGNKEGWDPDMLAKAQSAAAMLLDRDVWPWFNQQWLESPVASAQLANIPVIALVRAAQLARVVQNARKEVIETRARQVLQSWCQFRMGNIPHTEGTAYDGFLLDSVTEWMESLPDRKGLLREAQDAFRSQAEYWQDLALPGRADLHAPIGDVEAEMTFWVTALTRFADWYQWPNSAWLLRQIAPDRMRAGALVDALNRDSLWDMAVSVPEASARQHPNALSLRSGWMADDALIAVGFSRGRFRHLHNDSGQVVLGWQGRFWITDPGYQQYRPGEERDYTVGVQAHNAPVIAGKVQTRRSAKLLRLEEDAGGWQHVKLNLAACYESLSRSAVVTRDVWFFPSTNVLVVVRDQFDRLGTNVPLSTAWQLGAHLGVSFDSGWARLSDGEHALWFGSFPDGLTASQVNRHPGSRETLALSHTNLLSGGKGSQWWVFLSEQTGRWKPPRVWFNAGKLSLAESSSERVVRLPD